MEKFFPHLTSTGPAPSHRQVMDAYRAAFAQRVAEGSIRPLVLPYHFYGCISLLIYLCIPHTKSRVVYAARWPLLLGILSWQWKTTREVSSVSMATAYAAGMVSALGAVLAVTWLVFYKPQVDARRVQRRLKRVATSAVAVGCQGNDVGHRETIGYTDRSAHGYTTGTQKGNGSADLKYRQKPARMIDGASLRSSSRQELEYYWQSYPEKFWDRYYWVSDLLISFRLPGWNLAIPPMPALPPFIKIQLGEPVDATSRSGVSSIGLQRYDTREELFRSRIPTFVAGYFLLDVLKVVMMKDPYYIFGPTTYDVPSYLQGYSPLTVGFIREVLSAIAVILSLEMTFLLAPVFICLILGPELFGLRAEAWYWPDNWGSWSNISEKGLAGLWGGWWHQSFRFVFSAPSNFLIRAGYVRAGSPMAKFLALFLAFGISGFLHFAGSTSQFPSTHAWHAPIFFTLQALGIVLQLTVCSILHPTIEKLPRSVRRAGNFTFVLAWLFATGWWLADDFARGGIWLYEPIPISPLRGLGFGVKGDGWWCWEHIGVGWYSGKHWWESGLAL
ncbi:hypothetical protein BUE80_DR006229 [Diplocarpon rosae]|nr:hypothetical protein BUE80_DR006229 [Diplocarpon rosae]